MVSARNLASRLLAGLLAVLMIFNLTFAPAYAAGGVSAPAVVPTATHNFNHSPAFNPASVLSGSSPAQFIHHQPANLDLSSATRSISVHRNIDTTIQEGGALRTITQQSLLTPAERLVLQEVLKTGQQTLQLNALGQAIGGTADLSRLLSHSIGSLVVPQGVTIIDKSASSLLVQVSGNLV